MKVNLEFIICSLSSKKNSDMFIDDLPDDCLLAIFYLINTIDDLLIFAEVCPRWSRLVCQRLRKVKYLSDGYPDMAIYPKNTIFYNQTNFLYKIQLSKFLPNLRILDIPVLIFDRSYGKRFDLEKLNSTKGLIYLLDGHKLSYIDKCFEMVSSPRLAHYFLNSHYGSKLKQLHLTNCNLESFSSCAKYLPNLLRLHLEDQEFWLDDVSRYKGPILEKVEIFECSVTSFEDSNPYPGFDMADYLPSLKSAFHYVDRSSVFVNQEIKNYYMEDLVLQNMYACSPDWNTIKGILRKYPNLKHLAIRSNIESIIEDAHIPEIIRMLPQITIIDVRNSSKITDKTIRFIDEHNKRNKPISFYYKTEQRLEIDWPQFSAERKKICQGLDFMKNCFLKPFDHLPCLMDPLDDK